MPKVISEAKLKTLRILHEHFEINHFTVYKGPYFVVVLI